MKKTIIPYIIVVVSCILLLLNIYNLDFDNLDQSSFYGIISNILLMTFGGYLIFQSKKNG